MHEILWFTQSYIDPSFSVILWRISTCTEMCAPNYTNCISWMRVCCDNRDHVINLPLSLPCPHIFCFTTLCWIIHENRTSIRYPVRTFCLEDQPYTARFEKVSLRLEVVFYTSGSKRKPTSDVCHANPLPFRPTLRRNFVVNVLIPGDSRARCTRGTSKGSLLSVVDARLK